MIYQIYREVWWNRWENKIRVVIWVEIDAVVKKIRSIEGPVLISQNAKKTIVVPTRQQCCQVNSTFNNRVKNGSFE